MNGVKMGVLEHGFKVGKEVIRLKMFEVGVGKNGVGFGILGSYVATRNRCKGLSLVAE